MKEQANEFLTALIQFFQLQHWEIRLEFASLPDDDSATCSINSSYQQAVIVVDLRKHKDDEELWDSIVHEVMHVVLAPIENVADALRAVASGPTTEKLIEDAVERSVCHLTRSFIKGWNLKPHDLKAWAYANSQ